MMLHLAALPSTWHEWTPDAVPTIALATVAAVYGAGVAHAWQKCGVGRGISVARAWSFAAAMGVLALALLSPLDAMSDDLFAAHMTQHVLLAVVAPPFLVIGAPLLALLWLLPATPRAQFVRSIRDSRFVRSTWRAITAPPIACALHLIAVWSWHAPRLYDLALRNSAVHVLEHGCFVGTAALLWWQIVYPRRARRTAYAAGIATLFVTAMQTGVLGALLTFSHRALYPAQALGAAAWGFTPLEDQQLAGLIMWVPGGLLYVVAMSVLFVKWLAPATPPANTRAIGTPRTAIALTSLFILLATFGSGCSRNERSSVPGGDVARGRQTITAMGCGACHAIAGIQGAVGQVGPPLSGIARRSIIAGQLPNTPDNMVRWIQDPPSIEPRTAMPNLGVDAQTARDIAAYLYTLR
jgi:cytochrome c oxidase assembly factor CtaG/cytochrome c2